MDKSDFFQWLRRQGCEIIPKEGINNSAPPVEIVNRKTGRYKYIALDPRYDDVPRGIIEALTKHLGIQPPDNF